MVDSDSVTSCSSIPDVLRRVTHFPKAKALNFLRNRREGKAIQLRRCSNILKAYPLGLSI